MQLTMSRGRRKAHEAEHDSLPFPLTLPYLALFFAAEPGSRSHSGATVWRASNAAPALKLEEPSSTHRESSHARARAASGSARDPLPVG